MNNFGVNGSTPLTHVPMLMAHDAGSGYLGAGLVNRWTKTQPGGLAKQLDCGARAFDARPLFKDGQVVWHHGSIVIDHPFEQSVADILAWLSKHPTELVLLPISDCEGGDDCMAGVRAALSKLLVTEISDCAQLEGLTLNAARSRGMLASGGAMLAVTGAPLSSGTACSDGNYDSSIACSSLGFACWTSDATRDRPIGKLLDYLDGVAAKPLGGRSFTQSQALWQESTDSVVIGTLRNSSLLADEEYSQLNTLLAQQVRTRRWPHLNFLEVNNVCDGGGDLWNALQEVYYA